MKEAKKNLDREKAYQQLTDLRAFCSILEEIDQRATTDGAENAVEAARNYIPLMKKRIEDITSTLMFLNQCCCMGDEIR